MHHKMVDHGAQAMSVQVDEPVEDNNEALDLLLHKPPAGHTCGFLIGIIITVLFSNQALGPGTDSRIVYAMAVVYRLF